MIQQNVAEVVNKRPPEGLDRAGKPYSVMVVDDSAVMRKMISQILKSEAYDVVGEAENGEAAIAMYEKLKPAVVTMDINMPIMSGVEALEKILGTDPNAKIVMLTSEGQKDTVLDTISRGAKNFITKPPERRKVLEKIKLTLET